MPRFDSTSTLPSQLLYLDTSEVRFPAVPGTPGAWDLDESPQAGSSVDVPPRPCHTTPDSSFGTEVSLYRIGLGSFFSLWSSTRAKPVSRLGLTGVSI